MSINIDLSAIGDDQVGAARYLIAEDWDHVFEGIGKRTCRYVYDREKERLIHLQLSRGARNWRNGTEAQRSDVEDSLRHGNEEALENPSDWGIVQCNELPSWMLRSEGSMPQTLTS